MNIDWPGIGPLLVGAVAWYWAAGLVGLGIAIATWDNR